MNFDVKWFGQCVINIGEKGGVLWGYTIAVIDIGIAYLLVDVAFADLSVFSVGSTMEESVACLPCVKENLPS